MQKIPFAINHSTGELVEVGSVVSGRGCGCVCPSCGASVVARKGDKNQWHFAHDKDPKIKEHSFCEISFYVCCKRFVVEQMVKGESLALATPDYILHERQVIKTSFSFTSNPISLPVTQGKILRIDQYAAGGAFDLQALVGGHVIDILLDHPGRSLPNVMGGLNGVLLVDLRYIADQYEGAHTTPALIQQAVTDLFSENSTSKCWLYHPREVEVRKRLQQNLFVVQAGVAWQIEAPTQVKQPQPQILACKMCKSKWLSNPGEPIMCKTCNTHLYVVTGIE
ncbi:hypothetical protein [Cellvibrio mixtus]|nr:hypothetical protein [Cellvibrio mixtus]